MDKPDLVFLRCILAGLMFATVLAGGVCFDILLNAKGPIQLTATGFSEWEVAETNGLGSVVTP